MPYGGATAALHGIAHSAINSNKADRAKARAATCLVPAHSAHSECETMCFESSSTQQLQALQSVKSLRPKVRNIRLSQENVYLFFRQGNGVRQGNAVSISRGDHTVAKHAASTLDGQCSLTVPQVLTTKIHLLSTLHSSHRNDSDRATVPLELQSALLRRAVEQQQHLLQQQ
jgi:hypothetical protein